MVTDLTNPDVVILTDYFPPDPGNRARRMFERARFLVRSGKKVCVYAPYRELGDVEITYPAGMEVVRVRPAWYKAFPSLKYEEYAAGVHRILKPILPLLGYVRWIFPVVKHIRKRRDLGSTALYSPNNPIVLHVIAFMVRKRFVRWVAELRDPITGYVSSKRGVWGRLDRCVERLVFKSATFVALRSGIEVSGAELKKRYPVYRKKVVELPDYGVDLADFAVHDDAESKQPGGVLRGVYAGNFYVNDTPEALSEAVAACNREGRRFAIDYYGQWSDRWLQPPGVVYRGAVSYWELIRKYKEADFLILFAPTTQETAGLWIPSKISELLAAQKPIFVVGGEDSIPAIMVRKNQLGVVTANEFECIKLALEKLKDFVLTRSLDTEYLKKVRDSISNERGEEIMKNILCYGRS